MNLKFLLLFFSFYSFKELFCGCCCSKKKNNNTTNDYKDNYIYFLNSGAQYGSPLNIKWANCNCAILSNIRFFLSDKDLLDKILNKKISDHIKDDPKINSSQFLDKTSELFKKILKNKGNYNVEINEIINILGLEKTIDAHSFLWNFINIYFWENFKLTNTHSKGSIETTIDAYYKLLEQNDTNDYWAILNPRQYDTKGINKIKLEEFIDKKQNDNSIKKYELIGVIGACGDYNSENALKDRDFVSILPCFDENKLKKGYVIYQLNSKSKVMSIDELNKLENFGGWGNPRFHILIYKKV